MTRVSIPKKTRFEVFKRDKFTCAYCGESAPNVVLNVDHIKPVAKGGNNGILNLITACFACNSGKSDRELSDSSVVKKQVNQASMLQEKQEQLKMMAQWVEGIGSIEEQTIDLLEKHWFKTNPKWSWTIYGRKDIKKLIKKCSFIEITTAMDVCLNTYIKDFNSDEQRGKAFDKIGAVLYMTQKAKDEPNLKQAFYCRGILKNRITLFKPEYLVLEWLKSMIEYHGGDDVILICKSVKNWTAFRDAYHSMFEDDAS